MNTEKYGLPATQVKLRVDTPFFQVPNDIFEISQDRFQLLVLTYLYRCGNQGSAAFPSYKTIATKCHISRRKAIDVVKALERLSLIKKEVTPYRSNTYLITLPSAQRAPPSAQHAPPSAQHAPPSAQHAPPSAQRAHYKEPSKINNINNDDIDVLPINKHRRKRKLYEEWKKAAQEEEGESELIEVKKA